MRTPTRILITGALCAVLAGNAAIAAVSAEEAQKLGTTLTPLGGEKAGNADGTIPAWDGGFTTPIAGFENGGRRPDPFADEKPLFSITAKNMGQYGDKLTEGTKALLQKYPDTFRVDVYSTHRTAAAPQWVYDNTFKNATRATLAGIKPEGAYGGIPFPIPQSGLEVMWNHELRWRGTSWHMDFEGWMGTADGKHVLLNASQNEHVMPYYYMNGSPEDWNGYYWMVRSTNVGPPIRAGEIIVGRLNLEGDKTGTWVYLTGQRRVRRLPNSCCDTPTPFSAGLASFDEVDAFGSASNSVYRFDWKLLGKKEMYIPYNSNKTFSPKMDEVLSEHHLNPDHVRWELHRVWVVEANLREGHRHTSPRSHYYIDEDTWITVLADRWDAKDQLWRGLITLPMVGPDIPATTNTTWGFYDLLGGSFYINVLFNGKKEQYRLVSPPYPERIFTPDAMAGEGYR